MKSTTRKTPARHSLPAKDLRVAQLVFNTPWAVHEPKLREIAAVVRRHMAGGHLTEDQLRAIAAANEAPVAVRQGNGIVVIPVYGLVAYRMNMLTAISGGTSLQRLTGLMEEAANDAAISTVVMRYETPGGSVDGMTETAARIRELRGRGTKRWVACIDVRALSAGYWLASQCDEICITPSGFAGAIGIVTEHTDDSEAQKMEGELTEVISVPAKKSELMQSGPLSDDRRARMLDVMGQFYAMFAGDVAKGRGISVARVNADFGGGDMLTASEAKDAGMVDRVETFDATLSRLGTKRGAMVSVRAAAVPSELAADAQPHGLAIHDALDASSAATPEADIESEDGECPDGYELGDDGLCHLVKEVDATTEPATAEAAATDQAAADRDALAVALVL